MDYFFPPNKHRSASWDISFIYSKKKSITWSTYLDDMILRQVPINIAAQEQINKLGGITDGLIRHWNEFRFGWRETPDQMIDIFCYFYINGKRPSLPELEDKYKLVTIDPNKPKDFELTIMATQDTVRFQYTNIDKGYNIETILPYSFGNNFSWILQPYIGGRETYPEVLALSSEVKNNKGKIFTIFGL